MQALRQLFSKFQAIKKAIENNSVDGLKAAVGALNDNDKKSLITYDNFKFLEEAGKTENPDILDALLDSTNTTDFSWFSLSENIGFIQLLLACIKNQKLDGFKKLYNKVQGFSEISLREFLMACVQHESVDILDFLLSVNLSNNEKLIIALEISGDQPKSLVSNANSVLGAALSNPAMRGKLLNHVGDEALAKWCFEMITLCLDKIKSRYQSFRAPKAEDSFKGVIQLFLSRFFSYPDALKQWLVYEFKNATSIFSMLLHYGANDTLLAIKKIVPEGVWFDMLKKVVSSVESRPARFYIPAMHNRHYNPLGPYLEGFDDAQKIELLFSEDNAFTVFLSLLRRLQPNEIPLFLPVVLDLLTHLSGPRHLSFLMTELRGGPQEPPKATALSLSLLARADGIATAILEKICLELTHIKNCNDDSYLNDVIKSFAFMGATPERAAAFEAIKTINGLDAKRARLVDFLKLCLLTQDFLVLAYINETIRSDMSDLITRMYARLGDHEPENIMDEFLQKIGSLFSSDKKLQSFVDGAVTRTFKVRNHLRGALPSLLSHGLTNSIVTEAQELVLQDRFPPPQKAGMYDTPYFGLDPRYNLIKASELIRQAVNEGDLELFHEAVLALHSSTTNTDDHIKNLFCDNKFSLLRMAMKHDELGKAVLAILGGTDQNMSLISSMNGVDPDGKTALHHMCEKGVSEMVAYLLNALEGPKALAKIMAADKHGRTAFYYATLLKDTVIVQDLISKMLSTVDIILNSRDLGYLKNVSESLQSLVVEEACASSTAPALSPRAAAIQKINLSLGKNLLEAKNQLLAFIRLDLVAQELRVVEQEDKKASSFIKDALEKAYRDFHGPLTLATLVSDISGIKGSVVTLAISRANRIINALPSAVALQEETNNSGGAQVLTEVPPLGAVNQRELGENSFWTSLPENLRPSAPPYEAASTERPANP